MLAPRESVAEHSYRTAVVGLLLAQMLNLKKQEQLEVVVGCLLHDIEECYIGDLHKIAQNYLLKRKEKLEQKILSTLPEKLKQEYKKFLREDNKKIKEIIMDADKIECALSAKYYFDLGYKTKGWIDNIYNNLNTKIAKELLNQIKKMNTIEWIEKIKKEK